MLSTLRLFGLLGICLMVYHTLFLLYVHVHEHEQIRRQLAVNQFPIIADTLSSNQQQEEKEIAANHDNHVFKELEMQIENKKKRDMEDFKIQSEPPKGYSCKTMLNVPSKGADWFQPINFERNQASYQYLLLANAYDNYANTDSTFFRVHHRKDNQSHPVELEEINTFPTVAASCAASLNVPDLPPLVLVANRAACGLPTDSKCRGALLFRWTGTTGKHFVETLAIPVVNPVHVTALSVQGGRRHFFSVSEQRAHRVSLYEVVDFTESKVGKLVLHQMFDVSDAATSAHVTVKNGPDLLIVGRMSCEKVVNPVFYWDPPSGKFQVLDLPSSSKPVIGAGVKHIESFEMNGRYFFALSNQCHMFSATRILSLVYEYDTKAKKFQEVARLRTHAGTTLTHFESKSGNHYLAACNYGVVGTETQSMVYKFSPKTKGTVLLDPISQVNSVTCTSWRHMGIVDKSDGGGSLNLLAMTQSRNLAEKVRTNSLIIGCDENGVVEVNSNNEMQQVQAPVFSPKQGTIVSPLVFTISTSTPDAKIMWYSESESDDDPTHPLKEIVNKDELVITVPGLWKLSALATKKDMRPSEIATVLYMIEPASIIHYRPELGVRFSLALKVPSAGPAGWDSFSPTRRHRKQDDSNEVDYLLLANLHNGRALAINSTLFKLEALGADETLTNAVVVQELPSVSNHGWAHLWTRDGILYAFATHYYACKAKNPRDECEGTRVWRWQDDHFEHHQWLHTVGSSHAYAFSIGKEPYISISENMVSNVSIFRYEKSSKQFVLMQSVFAFAAGSSTVIKPSETEIFLIGAVYGCSRSSMSLAYKWNITANEFQWFQNLPQKGGAHDVDGFAIGKRHFVFISSDCDEESTQIFSELWEYKEGKFVLFQSIKTYGAHAARGFRSLGGNHFLAIANFGWRQRRRFSVMSPILIFNEKANEFQPLQDIPTHGATDWHHFVFNGRDYLAVCNEADEILGPVITSDIYLLEEGE